LFTPGEQKLPLSHEVAPVPSPVLGPLLYREHRRPSRVVPVLLVVVSIAAMWRGLEVASSGGAVGCTGRGGFVCTAAMAMGQVIFGLSAAHVFYGAFLVATGLVFLSIAWEFF
jgi:hypothetical protein